MSLVAEFSLPVDGFVLGDALQLGDIDRIDFDCNIPARSDVMPYFWVWGSRFDEFERVAERETALECVRLVDELEHNRLYRAEWRTHVSYLLGATCQSNGLVRGVTGENRWEIDVLFERRDDLQAFSSYYSGTAFDLKLERLYSLCDPVADCCELTPAQRETLVTAEQAGYYDQPSEVTMEELADRLDVSLAAVSGRLRRGTSRLIRSTLL